MAPPATFLASVPFDALRTRSVVAVCTEASIGYVRPPYCTLTTRTRRYVWSFEFLAVFASVTSNVAVAPSGMLTPFDADTGSVSAAVNLSPTATVLLHTLLLATKRSAVPAATVPETGSAGAAGAGVGAGVVGAGVDGFGRVGVGRGVVGRGVVGRGVVAAGAGAAGTGAGTSCNCGCTLSRCAKARSRPKAVSLLSAAVSSLAPPQAARDTSASVDRTATGADRRLKERIY